MSRYLCSFCNRTVQIADPGTSSPSCPVCSTPLLAASAAADSDGTQVAHEEVSGDYFLG
ncbi:MAG: hypothetical protein M3161_02925 [Actinomycetota bacterium]|nr:hypothetical protein [Actinomycetota bacterium]